MVPKVPLGAFLFSLAYLLITLVFHFRENSHQTRAIRHELQRAKDAAVGTRNQSHESHGHQERPHGSLNSAVTEKLKSTFNLDQDPDPVPLGTRQFWMRQASQALWEVAKSPCPFAAFGAVIVNHTDSNGLGDLICMGANSVQKEGNPTLHGEIAAINNCSSLLHPALSRSSSAFHNLSIYTTAEPCPMCASAIRWAGFKECIFGTSVDTLASRGFDQISIPSAEVFERTSSLPTNTRLLGGILANETDPLFSWQFDEGGTCPEGCTREFSGRCEAIWAVFDEDR